MDKKTTKLETGTAPHLWVGLYADYLYAFARQRIEDEDLARDLVQDTFLAALEGRDRFKGLSMERTWMVSILKFKIIDAYRKNASIKQKAVYLDDVNNAGDVNNFFEENGHWKQKFQPFEIGIEDASAIENQEFEMILKRCMEKLPKLWSAVFKMKHLDDEGSPAICAALKISSSNFWVIMHRAKLSLRSCLIKNWERD